jgi:hypothetical protein
MLIFETNFYRSKVDLVSYSLLLFFLFKINRLFFIRDAKLKMYEEKKNLSNPRFSASFFPGATEYKINFDIKTEKISSFPNYVQKSL